MDDEIFEKAKGLLDDVNFSILDIPAACGYGSYQRFHKAYAEKSGYTPKRYRKKILSTMFDEAALRKGKRRMKRSAAMQSARVRAEEYKAFREKAELEKRMMKVSVVAPAQRLLAYTDKTVAEVADELNVNRVRLFRYFKALVGVSPGQYRKNAKVAGLVNSLVAGIVPPDQRPFDMP